MERIVLRFIWRERISDKCMESVLFGSRINGEEIK